MTWRIITLIGLAFNVLLLALAGWELCSTGDLTLEARAAPQRMDALSSLLMLVFLASTVAALFRTLIRDFSE